MQVTLQNIAFNHDRDLLKTGSFYLRRNETQIVPIPEWSNKCSLDPACAPAGYVKSRLPTPLTIKASFFCDDPSVKTIHIQAVECPARVSHILGPVEAKTVNLQQGQSGLVRFNLPTAKARIEAAGVSATNIAWQWQFSMDGKNWTNVQETRHRIYTVLEMPEEPWQPKSNSATEIHVPWTEVLDKACEWAEGAQHVDVAAEGITRNMYKLGEEKRVKYLDGAAVYARDKFECTKFLQLLTQGSGKGQTVSCHDCATVVSTFSNVLGAKLFQARMGALINTHPILLIGSDPEDWRGTTFGEHEVAWKRNFDAYAALFDACLQIDGDGHPEAGDPYHTALQPTNLVFGTGQLNSYRFGLFESGQCVPIPFSYRRRSLGPSPLGFPKITNIAFLNDLKARYKFDKWQDRSELNEESFSIPSFFDLPELGDAFDGFEKLTVRQFNEESFSNVIEVLLKRRNSLEEFVEITVYEAGPAEKPTEFLLQLLGHFELLNFTPLEEPVVGDVSFVAPAHVTVLLKRRNFVAAVRSVGLVDTRVIAMATTLDLALLQLKPIDLSTETRRTEMEDQTRNEITETRATADHPLADIWNSFPLVLGGFIRGGVLDLRTMNAQGVLTNGTFTPPGGTPQKLKGNAISVISPLVGGTVFALSLETDPRTVIYHGFVVLDTVGRTTMVGGFRLTGPSVPRFIEDLSFDSQNEGVWVLTKP